MDPARLQQIQDLYHAAVDHRPSERGAFLSEACGLDAELRREVESLLAQNGSSDGPMDRPAISLLAEAMVAQVSPGDLLGPYKIESLLGAGGMGQVYKARDTRLGRTVAIKISSQQFSDRFEREARTISSLNHPNVCTLHDIGPNYLVMELVEGPTLADRIARGPVPLDEAIAVAKQIAAALEAAHEKGIVHRDLKPANIKIRPDGSVKVLDFGLAKETAGQAALTSDSPTELSTSGMILGTAGYMSPEQARGGRVDKRADIWAFGVVLYEMVTGRSLFLRSTLSDTLAAVIKEEPDLIRLPMKVRRLLAKCLQKDPQKRLRDVGDWAGFLEEGGTEVPWQAKARPTWWVIAAAVALAAALVSAGLAFRAMSGAIGAAPRTFAHLNMELAPAEMLGGAFDHRPSRTAFAISPNGATVVFAGMKDHTYMLYRRSLAESVAVAIPETEEAEYPFFSPDGQWVGFEAIARGAYKLQKVALSGGPPIDICNLTGRIEGASWGSGGVIVFASGGLWTVPESGGMPAMLLDLSQGRALSPAFLPDAKTVLFTDGRAANWEEAHVDSIQVATKQRKTLLTNAADARYSPTGHLLFMRNAALLAVPFDAAHAQVSGSPVPLISDIMQATNAGNFGDETGMGQFAISSSGTLLYASGGIYPTQDSTLVRVDRNGTETKLAAIKGELGSPHLSPDGTRVVTSIMEDGSRRSDLWTYELPSGTATRLTSTGDAQWPLFSPDGKSITYSAFTGIYSLPLNGSGTPTRITENKPGFSIAASWSGDGKWLAYLRRGVSVWQLFVRPMQNPGESIHFAPSTFQVQSGEFSPDGRWIAYASDESGASEVYVQAFPGPGAKHRISTGGGTSPAWSRNGRELFYARFMGIAATYSLAMMAAEISSADGSSVGPPRTLFEGPYVITFPSRSYDVTPDGQFLMVHNGTPPDQKVTQLHVVLGWGEELKRRVASSTSAR